MHTNSIGCQNNIIMRVLQITTNYPTKANPIFGIFMKEQVESLEKYGVENTIFFSNGSETGVGMRYGGLRTHIKSIFKLQRHLLAHKYDVIHCHSAISGLLLLLSGGAFFHKCVISFQNDPEKEMDGLVFRFVYPFFNTVIVKKPNKYMDRKKIVYLPNGCNTDFFQPIDKNNCKKQLGLLPSKRYILFVDSNAGKKRIQKRRDRFEEVMRMLKQDYGHNNIEELVMIGVERDLVPIWVNSCDLHLLTSNHEGSPNSVKECLACNVPVVSTDVGNVMDLLSNIEGCYVSDIEEPKEIARLADLSLKGYPYSGIRDAFISKGLDIDSVARRIVAIYSSLTNK